MPLSQTELETSIEVTLSAPTTVQGGDLTAPAPVNVDTSVATKTISAATIPAVSISAPSDVSYSPISTTDAITDVTLNRTAETLKNDINSKLSAWATQITTQLGNVQQSANSSISGVASDTTAKLTEFRQELLDTISDVNAAFEEVRTKEIAQNNSVASTFNTVTGEMKANDDKLLAGLMELDAKLVALNDVFQSDAEAITKLADVQAFIATLRETDMDFVTAVDNVIDEVNGLKRVVTKIITVSSGTGLFNFNTLNEGVAEFTAAGDYTVAVEVIGNEQVSSKVINKTATAFDIQLKSDGVHFKPQPWKADETPVQIEVKIFHEKLNPTTLNIDTLSASWLTEGNGTDANTVGA